MTDTTTLERLLLDDLDVEGERAADEKFCTELYRALTNNVWRNDRDPEGELSPSFKRAEWLVNQWRIRHGHAPLTLAQTRGEGEGSATVDHVPRRLRPGHPPPPAQTGGGGEVSATVDDVLGRLGWSHRPLPTDRDHPAHLGLDESPPPPDHGERMAPVPPSDEQERAAHEAASAERERKAG